MIHFNFDWSDTVSLVTLAAVIAILPIQLWLLVFRKSTGEVRKFNAVKLALNLVLWISILGFVLRPEFRIEKASATGILAGKEVPAGFLASVRDSLPHAEALSESDILKANLDTLVLIGQEFPQSLWRDLQQSGMQPVIRWVPFFLPDQVQSVHLKSLLYQGELQEVYGKIHSSDKQVLKVTYGGNTLDSSVLSKGINDFRLRFPAFAEGRTSVILSLDEEHLDTLRFFTRPFKQLTIRFILDNPDFESRNLASWLGKNGHAVIYDVAIAKDLTSTLKINAAKAPDLLITHAENANTTAVKKALSNGASVLFTGLIDQEAQIRSINAATGTTFQLRKTANEPSIKVLPGLDAAPYQFGYNASQLLVSGVPVAIQKRTGIVGVSLLNETFPMQLAGDTINYQKVWYSILAALLPPAERNLEITGPVYSGVKTKLSLNNFSKVPASLAFGNDTLFTTKSALNAGSATSEFIPRGSDWVTLRDSVPAEVFVEKGTKAASKAHLSQFISAHQTYISNLKQTVTGTRGLAKELPEWGWYLWLTLCFAALWIEDKFS
jgi:hypothetical protein